MTRKSVQFKKHQALGHDIVLVSASLDLYLQPICQALGIGLICTQTEHKDALLTGLYASPDCSREQKALRIQAEIQLSEYAEIYAYGNSEEDLAMLALADHTFMVGQDKTLPLLHLTSALS